MQKIGLIGAIVGLSLGVIMPKAIAAPSRSEAIQATMLSILAKDEYLTETARAHATWKARDLKAIDLTAKAYCAGRLAGLSDDERIEQMVDADREVAAIAEYDLETFRGMAVFTRMVSALAPYHYCPQFR